MEKELEMLLNEAILEREKGDPEKSIGLFQNLIFKLPQSHDILRVLNHQGLAYYHAAAKFKEQSQTKYSKYLKNSFDTFKNVADMTICGDTNKKCKGEKAVALRNLGRPEFSIFIPRGLEGSVNIAYKALQKAKKCNRKDLIWFTHGLLNARAALAKSKKEKFATGKNREIVWNEAWQLLWIARKEPKLNKQVWLLGLLKDVSMVYPKLVTKKGLTRMLEFAQKNKLERRAEQIQKAILELYPN